MSALTTIVDGISCTGLAPYSTAFRAVSDRVALLNLPIYAEGKNAMLLNLLRGHDMPLHVLPHADVTALHWDVKITGYAYWGWSVPYYLAMGVLFGYTVLALGHTGVLMYTQRSSSSWDSLEGIVVLCKNSVAEVDGGLGNTCGGESCLTRAMHIHMCSHHAEHALTRFLRRNQTSGYV